MTIRRQDDDRDNGSEPFLSRWSRLKRDDGRPAPKDEPARQAEPAGPQHPPSQVPPVEKLTPESDFSAFMGPKVQDAVRRVALKKLFTDPHFNVPDPFEPYSGDWTGEPIAEEVLKTLNQARTHLFPEEKKREEAQEQERIAAGKAAPAPDDGAGESHAATTDTLEEKHDEPGRQDA